MFHKSFMEEEISRMFHGCLMIIGVSRVFQGSFKKTFKVFQKSFMCMAIIAASRAEGGLVQECPNFNLGILKTEGGGLYFSKMSQLPSSV